jgi:lambda family phage portal protein
MAKRPFFARVSQAARVLFGRPQASTYRGATTSRLTDDWYPALLSADQALKADGRLLRARSRQLFRDNAHMAGYGMALRDNVVGPDACGIGVQARNTLTDGRPGFDRGLNQYLEERFGAWCMPEVCSADGRDSFGDLTRLYVTTLAMDGEVLWRELPGFDNEFGYAIQILDADQLDDSLNRPPTDVQNEIRQGVEVDQYNRAVAYWMWTVHPSEWGRKKERIRVPATELHHDFVKGRPGQTRGIPWLTPALFAWKMLDGYTEAEVVQARLAAAAGGFFTATGEDAALFAEENEAATEGPKPMVTMDLEPGLARQLPPGLHYEGIDPTHPNGNFAQFQKAILRMVARAGGTSYTTLSGDFENTNYSSGRMGLLPERDFYRFVAHFVTTRFNRPIYLHWLTFGSLSGALRLPSPTVSGLSAHAWEYRGWPWIDPLNDIQANERKLRLGLTSRQRLCAELGLDFEDVLEELKAENDLATAAGVDVSGIELTGRVTSQGAPPGVGTDENGNPIDANGNPVQVDENGSPVDPAHAAAADQAATDQLRSQIETYGIAVRAGSITPQTEDEDAFRQMLGLPPASAATRAAWAKDKGTRRPITLTPPEGAPRPAPFGATPADTSGDPGTDNGNGKSAHTLNRIVRAR